MAEDLQSQFRASVARRDQALQRVQRLQGRLQAATEALELLEQQCRDKGIDPARLDEYISKLESRYESEMENFDSQVAQLELQLDKYKEV